MPSTGTGIAGVTTEGGVTVSMSSGKRLLSIAVPNLTDEGIPVVLDLK